MATNGIEILADAIARNLAAVLSLPTGRRLRHRKSRFLSEDAGGFWVEGSYQDRELIEGLIGLKAPVGVTFRSGPQRVTFAAPIIGRNPDYQMNGQIGMEALQLSFPKEVHAVQRRNNFRVRVPIDSGLRLRVWRIPEHAYISDIPMKALELGVELRDISIGGIGVLLVARGDEPPKVLLNERLRVSMRPQGMDEMIFDARMRFMPPKGSPLPFRCGIQFRDPDDDVNGRQNVAVLGKLVGEFQQIQVRRQRLGMPAE